MLDTMRKLCLIMSRHVDVAHVEHITTNFLLRNVVYREVVRFDVVIKLFFVKRGSHDVIIVIIRKWKNFHSLMTVITTLCRTCEP